MKVGASGGPGAAVVLGACVVCLPSHPALAAPTVERRRRDKINNWIVQLSKIIPDCSMESTKSGQVRGGPGGGCPPSGACGRTRQPSLPFSEVPGGGERGPGMNCFRKASRASSAPALVLLASLQSKGGILSKACDYIQELRQSNHRLSEELQGLDQLQVDNDVLRQQVSFLTPGAPSTERLCPSPALVGVGTRSGTRALTAPSRCQVEDLKNKNLLLRAQLRHHGVEVVIKNDSN